MLNIVVASFADYAERMIMIRKDEASLKNKAEILYLHIGTHKTGTSALQKFFTVNEKRLNSNGILYPGTCRLPCGRHGDLTRSLNFNWPPEKPVSFEENIEKIKREMNGCRNILISDEDLWLEQSFDRLKLMYELAEKIIVIVYFRRQDNYLQSSYSQAVKIECNGDIETYASRNCDYKAVCDRWSSWVGKENVKVRIYEHQQFKDNSIFADFLSVLGVEYTDDYTIPGKEINPSLNVDALHYKLLINKLHGGKFGVTIFFRPILAYSRYVEARGGACDHNYLSPQQRLEIIDRHRESNSALAKEYLNRADGRLFYDLEPDPVAPWTPYAGLTEEKKDEISGFIARRYLIEFLLICQAVRLTMHMDKHVDPEVLRAARELSGIYKFLTFRNLCSAFACEFLGFIKRVFNLAKNRLLLWF